MVQEFSGGGPLFGLRLETAVEKVLQLLRELALILDVGLAVGGDEVECAERRLVQVGRLALNHLDHHDAQRPDVHLVAVVLSEDGKRQRRVRPGRKYNSL